MATASRNGRLPLVPAEELSSAQQELSAAIVGTRGTYATTRGYRIQDGEGRLIGPFTAFLSAPQIGVAQLHWAEAISQADITPDVREAVILTIASIWDSAYIRYAHSIAAARAGLSDNEITELLAGAEQTALTGAPGLGSRITRSLLLRHHVDADLYQAAVASFGVSGLVALIALVGQYTSTAMVLAGFDVPAPDDIDHP